MPKILAQNRYALRDYEILASFEAGLVLAGYEVKAIRQGKASLRGSWVSLKKGEAFLVKAHIGKYQPKNIPADYNPERARKLLLTKKELSALHGKGSQKGLTLIPLKLYTKRGKIKLKFGLARGLKKVDKRQRLKEKEFERQRARLIKGQKWA